MKLKLTLQERISLAMILPDSGSYLSVLITEEIKEKIQPSIQEIEALNIKQEGNVLTWDAEKEKTLVQEFEFSRPELELLKQRVKEIDEQKAVTKDNFRVIHKLMTINIPTDGNNQPNT